MGGDSNGGGGGDASHGSGTLGLGSATVGAASCTGIGVLGSAAAGPAVGTIAGFACSVGAGLSPTDPWANDPFASETGYYRSATGGAGYNRSVNSAR